MVLLWELFINIMQFTTTHSAILGNRKSRLYKSNDNTTKYKNMPRSFLMLIKRPEKIREDYGNER